MTILGSRYSPERIRPGSPSRGMVGLLELPYAAARLDPSAVTRKLAGRGNARLQSSSQSMRPGMSADGTILGASPLHSQPRRSTPINAIRLQKPLPQPPVNADQQLPGNVSSPADALAVGGDKSPAGATVGVPRFPPSTAVFALRARGPGTESPCKRSARKPLSENAHGIEPPAAASGGSLP